MMSDSGPEGLVLVFLRRLDASLGDLRGDVGDMKHRMTALEIQVAHQVSTEASHYASLATRLDRFGDRLERIERRLDLVEAPAA